MKHFALIFATLIACTHENTIKDANDSQAPDASVQEQCVRETSEYGFCTRNLEFEGAWKLTGMGSWGCDCTAEQMDMFERTGKPPNCCVWQQSAPYGYAYVTPRSESNGTVVVHTERSPETGTLMMAQYDILTDGTIFIDDAYFVQRTYSAGQETVGDTYKLRHYIVTPAAQDNYLNLTFSIAYPQPIYKEKSQNYRMDFVLDLEKQGGVTYCFRDSPTYGIKLGHCHSGPVCRNLVAGCIPEFACSILTKNMTFFYSSWNPQHTNVCNVRFYDQYYSIVLNNYM